MNQQADYHVVRVYTAWLNQICQEEEQIRKNQASPGDKLWGLEMARPSPNHGAKEGSWEPP